MLQEEAFFAATRIQIFHRGPECGGVSAGLARKNCAKGGSASPKTMPDKCGFAADLANALRTTHSTLKAQSLSAFPPVHAWRRFFYLSGFYRLSTTVRCAGPLSS